MKQKKYTGIIPAFLVLFAILFWINQNYILDSYQPRDLELRIKLKVEEDDEFQLFYRDSASRFSEAFSEKIKIKGSPDWQQLVFDIPDTLQAAYFRFDIGNEFRASPVVVRQMIFRFNGNNRVYESENLWNIWTPNRFIRREGQKLFRLQRGGRSDPFLRSGSLESALSELREDRNLSRLLLNSIISGVLALGILIALKQSGRSRSPSNPFDILFIGAFLAMIVLPTLDGIWNLDPTVLKEKRDLAPVPEFRYAEVETYPGSFEAYYNDRFGFRSLLISTGATVKIKGFQSTPDTEKLVVGKEDWLFYWHPDARASYTRANPFTPERLDRRVAMISEANDWASANDAFFVTAIFPNKHTVYEAFLPDRIKALKQDRPSRREQWSTRMLKEGLPFVEITPAILQQKKVEKEPLYFRNDSHWNALGAHVAYREVLEAIHENVDGVSPPIPVGDFDIERDSAFSQGDLLDYIGVDNRWGYFKDDLFRLSRPERDAFHPRNEENAAGHLTVINANAGNDKTLLVIGDSYTIELRKLLPRHFRKTIFVRNIEMNRRTLEKYMPDVLFYGVVERNLESL